MQIIMLMGCFTAVAHTTVLTQQHMSITETVNCNTHMEASFKLSKCIEFFSFTTGVELRQLALCFHTGRLRPLPALYLILLQ